MTRHPKRQPLRASAALLLLLLALIAASCSSDDKSESGDEAGGDGSSQTSAAADCPGEPVKLMQFAALTGGPTGAVDMDQARIGIDAALTDINGTCSLGRPVEVTICDDKFDVNGSLACGREATENGTLAIVNTVGSFDDGIAASGLPGIYMLGTSAFELTNAKAYSSVSGVTVGMGGVSAAKAAGAETFLLVLPDIPALQFVSGQVEEAGKQLDIEVETIFTPIDATDFAPVAAQIAERDTDAVGMLPSAPVPLINALAAEGITPETKIMSIASFVLTPEIVEELGDAMNGMLVVASTMPTTDTENPGIAEFRAAVEANGEDPDDPLISFATVIGWSNLKKLEAALLAAGPEVIASLNSQNLVDAVVANPIDRPEQAPYDFREHQLPEFPGLAAFRIFTREVALLELNDGKYEAVADEFVDVLDPPTLE